MKANQQFERGVALFNARKFFEAHEAWEELWLAEPQPEKTFLQGLIQLAAALHHCSRGNSRGAKSLLAAGIAKLELFPGRHRGLALAQLRAQATRWVGWLSREEGPQPPPPKIRVVGRKGLSRAPSRSNTIGKPNTRA
jgi:predicted metal-dependent hydrolase